MSSRTTSTGTFTSGDIVALEYLNENDEWAWTLGTLQLVDDKKIAFTKWRSTGDGESAQAREQEVRKNEEIAREQQQCAGYERELAKCRTQLLVSRGDAEDSTHQSKTQLDMAEQAVSRLDEAQLREIRSYRTPPQIVLQVLDAVTAITEEVPPNGRSWEEVRRVVNHHDFIPKILSFDPSKLTSQQRRALEDTYVRTPGFTFDKAAGASRALGPLQQWVAAQVAYGVARDNLDANDESVGSLAHQLESLTVKIRESKTRLKQLFSELNSVRTSPRRETSMQKTVTFARGDGQSSGVTSSIICTFGRDGGAQTTQVDRDEVEALFKQRQQLWGSALSAQRELASNRDALELLRRQLDEARSTAADLRRHSQQFEGENLAASARYRAFEIQRVESDDQIRRQREEIERLNALLFSKTAQLAKMNDASQRVSAIESERVHLVEQLQLNATEFAERLAAAEEALHKAQKNGNAALRRLSSTLEKTKADLDQALLDLQKARLHANVIEQQYETERSALVEQLQAVKLTETEYYGTKQQLTSTTEERNALASELQSSQLTLASTRDSLATLQSEHDRLRRELDVANPEKVRALRELESSRVTLRNLQADWEKERATLLERIKVLQALEGEVATLKNRISILESEKQTMLKDIQLLRGEIGRAHV